MRDTVSLVWLNQRHKNSSQYLSTFRPEVRDKPGKYNIIPNALSRLNVRDSGDAKLQQDKNSSENIQESMYPVHKVLSDTLAWAFPVFKVQVSKQFLEKLKNVYQNDIRCVRLIKQI